MRSLDGLSSVNHPHHKIYALYKQINDRCHKKEHKNYPAYGARGVVVCDEWRRASGKIGRERLFLFIKWCLDNGWLEGLHLDRIDNDGPYAPWNCQFIPAIENIFYASIDNASEEVLRTFYRYQKTWEYALGKIPDQEAKQSDFFQMTKRWGSRLKRRARELNIQLA
jgi:hypothetical protein